MANFITKNQLKSYVEYKGGTLNKTIALFEAKIAKAILPKSEFDISVFISHSHKNKDLVEYLVALLKKMNVDVYLDWKDEELSYPPSGETAEKIKSMIDNNNKFILLATNEGIESKWCNWELGLGDVHKYIEHIALLPVADNSGDWYGNEYLQIYPYIDKNYKNLEMDDDYSVIFPDGKKIDFVQWLKSK